MANAQPLQVGQHGARRVEAEVLVQLQAVGGARRRHRRGQRRGLPDRARAPERAPRHAPPPLRSLTRSASAEGVPSMPSTR